jgi:hypothetical protein
MPMRRCAPALVCVFLVANCIAFGQTTTPLNGIEGERWNQQAIAEFRSSQESGKTRAKNVAVFIGDTVIPHIVDGGSWSTAITLTNLDNKRLTAQILFFRDDGTDLLLPVVGQGTVRGMDLTLDPNTTLTLTTAGTSATTLSGWASILKGTTDAIGGIAVFRDSIPGRGDSEAVVPIVSRFDDRAVLLFDNTNGFVTAAAFANPNPMRAPVEFTVRSENGSVLERKTITLDPFTHSAGTIPATFNSTVGRRGSIEFNVLNQFGVGALGLRFSPRGSFTSFHALSNINWLLN